MSGLLLTFAKTYKRKKSRRPHTKVLVLCKSGMLVTFEMSNKYARNGG